MKTLIRIVETETFFSWIEGGDIVISPKCYHNKVVPLRVRLEEFEQFLEERIKKGRIIFDNLDQNNPKKGKKYDNPEVFQELFQVFLNLYIQENQFQLSLASETIFQNYVQVIQTGSDEPAQFAPFNEKETWLQIA